MAKNDTATTFSFLNTNLLGHLPENLGHVLDIGCGTGELGAEYKKNNKRTIWHGIEINKDALQLAKKNLNNAWEMNADAFTFNATIKKEAYDALVYSLSLEQFDNPAKALESHLKVLKKDGKLFFCFPNVQHWSLLRHLISGNWDATAEKGILHQDNIHHFTRKSFIGMLDGIGLKMIKMHRYSYEQDAIFRKRRGARIKTIHKLRDFCEDTKLYYNENDFRTYHYVMIATRK